ncbi:MAG: branched-chain amino acid ABC transporter permease [Acidimicrobiales bacterium]
MIERHIDHQDQLFPRRGVGVSRRRLLIAATIGLLAVPIFGSTLTILLATEMIVFVVAFSGLHILSGRLGLISVGHGAFIGIGALAAAHGIDDLSIPYLLAPLLGAVGAAAVGLVIGVPSLRLPGTYLALLTLAVAMVLPITLRWIDGPLGYRVDGNIGAPAWTGMSADRDDTWQYLLVLIGGAAIMVAVQRATRGRFTRAMLAVRDEPTAAAAFGIDVRRTHLTGVALSAGLAGAAGGLSLYATPFVSGDQYPFSLSVAMFALMLAIGASHLWTSIPAAIILVALPEILTRSGRSIWEPIVYAAVLLVMTRLSRGRGLLSLWPTRGSKGRPAGI